MDMTEWRDGACDQGERRTPLKSVREPVDGKTVRDVRGWLNKAVGSVRRDLSLAVLLFFRNSVAGSALVPQIVRTMLYRLSGLDIRSFNVREGQVIDNSNIHIGDHTFVNRHCSFEGHGSIYIGDDCKLGPEIAFITSSHDRLPDGTIDNVFIPGEIRVEDGAWIGARSVILPGSVIERDCIIAAGAVVRGRCLAGQAYGGVPARLLESSRLEGSSEPLHLSL
jgi:maltose O-acetyltransferase